MGRHLKILFPSVLVSVSSQVTWSRSHAGAFFIEYGGLALSQAKSESNLDTAVSPKSKPTRPIRKPKATWVDPEFYADVEYRDITSEGLLRASSFKGLSKGT